jgi:prepilin-type N-terminal cleavage/methylation domain-containing protein
MTIGCFKGMPNRKAFTLIELLVVVLIIGILAAIAVPQYIKAVEKSRASQLFIHIKALYDAQQIYFLAHNAYTSDFKDLDIDFAYDSEEIQPGGNTIRFYDSSKTRLLAIRNSPTAGYHLQAVGYISGEPYNFIYYLDDNSRYCETRSTLPKAMKICEIYGKPATCHSGTGVNKCYAM